jgi:MoaA/NifB/PqqE/SkfB family radical SAM enzyme
MQLKHFWRYRRIVLSQKFFRAARCARQNAIAERYGRKPACGPYMAEFDITYRCNCSCMMCDRWQDQRRDALDLPAYQRLAAELDTLGTHQISIAGGEPLMRNDVFDIIAAFADRGMSVNVCTNGMLVEQYQDQLCASGATCITVSIDGAEAVTHDALRGSPGGFERVEAGIRALMQKPARRRPIVRVRITISNRNLPELNAFYHKWVDLADDVLIQPVHTCTDAYYSGLEQETGRLDPEALAAQLKQTAMAQDPYMQTLVEALRHEGLYPDQTCYAGLLMVRIDPFGDVYPCLEQHVAVGSVLETRFTDLWHSEAFQNERQRLATRKTCRCWYNNTALIGHYGQLLSRTALPTLTPMPQSCAVTTVQSKKRP